MENNPTVTTAVRALEDLKRADAAWNAAADAGDIERMRHYESVIREIWRRADGRRAG